MNKKQFLFISKVIRLLFFAGLPLANVFGAPDLLRPLLENKKILSANIKGVESYKAYHRNCQWQSVVADNSKLDALSLERCQIRDSTFKGAELRNLTSLSTDWRNIDFTGADLRGSTWIRSSCLECDFRGADLRDSTLFIFYGKGSRFNQMTKFPFAKSEALRRGFIYVE